MIAVLEIVLPIFALIFAGWAVRRSGVFGPHASSELNRFVVYLALPALLFNIVADAHWSEIWRPGFVASFGLGAVGAFAVALLTALYRRRRVADAAIDGLNAAYANTGFIGFPLALSVFGASALAPTLIATILTVCVVFAIALILVEAGLQTQRHPVQLATKLLLSLARNPLLVAPALGAVLLVMGLKVPAPAESFLKLLGGAASPCALVALGLFLGENRGEGQISKVSVGLLVFLKLLIQPALTWLLAKWVFHLQPVETDLATLLAALPTGTGPFMVAEFYGREAGITSRVVLISTILSLATISAYLHLAT